MFGTGLFVAQDSTGDNPPEGFGIEPVDLTMAAFVLPPIISIINQRKWISEVKALTALLVCAVYSAGVTVVRHEINWLEWRNALLQVAAGTFISYKMFWIPSGLAAKIENATSIPPADEEQDRDLPPTTMQELPVHGGGQPSSPPPATEEEQPPPAEEEQPPPAEEEQPTVMRSEPVTWSGDTAASRDGTGHRLPRDQP